MNKFIALISIAVSAFAVETSLGQTWTRMQNVPNIAAYNPILLFDGTVLVQNADSNQWFRLSPDSSGNYVDGTWTQLPSTGNFSPLYYASQVMPDGRVFMEGGEYNGGGAIWSNLGMIYDPTANTWTALAAPSGWSQIGDMGSIVLPNGGVLVQEPFTNGGALFNWSTNSFTSPYGTGKRDRNDEEGLTLLQNGLVLTVDVPTLDGAELFNPANGTWTPAANTPYNLVDQADGEIGPQVVRPDGTVICFGGNGSNAVYHPATNTWTAAPAFPTVGGAQLTCADAPACLLPNGKVLVDTAPGYGADGTVFFEFDGTSMNVVPGPPNAASDTDFIGSMLTLPTGQIMFTDFSGDIELYTSSGTYNSSWAPTITSWPSIAKQGSKFQIGGTQLTGLSGASAYGDDEQNETNYPLIKVTNNATGHVMFFPQSNLSTRAIATGSAIETASFLVPKNAELGASTIQVITNGIPSAAKAITIAPPVQASSVFVYQGTAGMGSPANVYYADGLTYSTGSQTTAAGQTAAIEADFTFPTATTNGLTISVDAKAAKGVTEQIYAFNYKTNTFVLINSYAFGTGMTDNVIQLTTNGSQYLSATGQAKILIRGVLPNHVSPSSYTLAADLINVILR